MHRQRPLLNYGELLYALFSWHDRVLFCLVLEGHNALRFDRVWGLFFC